MPISFYALQMWTGCGSGMQEMRK